MASRRGALRGGGLPSTTAQECDRCQGDSEGSLMFPCGRQVTLCIACTTMFTDFLQLRMQRAQSPLRPSARSTVRCSSRPPDSPPSARQGAASTNSPTASMSPIRLPLMRAAALHRGPQQQRSLGSHTGSEGMLGKERRDKLQSSTVWPSPMDHIDRNGSRQGKAAQCMGKEPRKGAGPQDERSTSQERSTGNLGDRLQALSVSDERQKAQKMTYDSLSSPVRQGIAESPSAADGDSRSSSQSSESLDLSRATAQEPQESHSSSSDEQIITPSAKAAQKHAGKLRATAGQLLQVTEPVPSPSSLVLQSRISAVHMFGFAKSWQSERSRKGHADSVAALFGSSLQANSSRAASNTSACLLHSRDGNDEVRDEPSTNPQSRLNSQLHPSRAQSARHQNRFHRQQSSVVVQKGEVQGGVHDLPAGSPVLMRTGNVSSMSLVFGEGLLGENDKALESPEQHKIGTNSPFGALPRNRGSETATGMPPRPVSRAHLSSNQEEMVSASPHKTHKSYASRRLASATRRAAAGTKWMDLSPASASSAWANARPGTALGDRPSTAIGARAEVGSSFQPSGRGSSLSFSNSSSGKIVVMDGGLLVKKPDEQTMFWRGSSQLGYRKRSALAIDRSALVGDVRDASLECEPCNTV